MEKGRLLTEHRVRLGYLLTKVFIILIVCHENRSQPCQDLKIWQEDTQIETSDLCEMQYNTPNCTAFLESFNTSDLPYPISGYSVEKPASINIIPSGNPYNGWTYTKLSFRWESPFAENSRAACQGYLLTWEVAGPEWNGTACRLFRFNSSSNLTKKLTFQFDIPYANQRSNHVVRVFSMPPPNAGDQDDPNAFVTMSAMTATAYKPDTDPGKWAPAITYQALGNGSINLKFSLSPPKFNFTLFEILLVNTLDPHNSMRSFNYIGEVASVSNPEGYHSFDYLPTGDYKIVIWVKDQHRGIPNMCQCWITVSNGTDCNSICGGTTTDWFHLNVITPATPPTSTPSKPGSTDEITNPSQDTSQAPITASSTRSGGSDDTALIIGLVVGGISLVTLLLAFVLCRRNGHRVKSWINSLLRRSKSSGGSWSPPGHLPPLPQSISSTSLEVPLLKEKTLYVMSADDHIAHRQCVETFVQFLQVHCRCDVIYPPQSYTYRMGGVYEWFQANMARSNRILFIDSDAAEKLILAHLNKQAYRARRQEPEGELFQTGLKHIMNDQGAAARENAIVVSFGGKHCQKYLQASMTYELPSQLPQLLCKIHDLDMKNREIYSSYLPMYVENIKQFAEGRKLLSAIDTVKAYEVNNPNWFVDNFGVPTPILERVMSEDEGYPPSIIDRTLSVSNQDIPSIVESPASIRSQPNFGSGLDMPPSLRSSGPAAISYKPNAPYPHTCIQREMRPQNDSREFGDYEDISVITVGTDILNGPKTVDPAQISVVTMDPNVLNGSEIAESYQGNRSGAGGISIIPPERASKIVFDDTVSSAVRKFNQGDDESDHHIGSSPFIPEAGRVPGFQKGPSNREELRGLFQPPDSLSDIQVDSISSAMREFNSQPEDFQFVEEREDQDGTDGHNFGYVSV